MFNLTLRQAETAFKDGRLDEACELALRDHVRQHFAGQKLITKLTVALLERGERHLAAERFDDAMIDCERARRLAGGQEAAASLRERILEARNGNHQRKARRAALLAAVKDQLRQGRLSSGGRMLEAYSDPGQSVMTLRREVSERQDKAAKAIERANAAMSAQAWHAAIDAAQQAKHAHGEGQAVCELVESLIGQVTQAIRQTLDRGRLDAAGALVKRLRPLACEDPRWIELDAVITDCAKASRAMARGGFAQVGRLLARAQQILPQAVWIEGALERTRRAAQEIEQIQAGPLGLLGTFDTTVELAKEPPPVENGPMNHRPNIERSDTPRPAETSTIGARFVLSVDGVGAFLVATEPSVTLGPVNGSARPTVGFLAPPDTPTATIQRQEDDYVLRAAAPVKVNDERTASRAIFGGDRIELSPRCRFTFTLPNPASPTAVLRLSGAKLPRRDLRQVILPHQSLVLGPGADAHVRTAELTGRTVLFLRDGRLFGRSDQPMEVNGRRADASTPIGPGDRVHIGDVTLMIRPWDGGAS